MTTLLVTGGTTNGICPTHHRNDLSTVPFFYIECVARVRESELICVRYSQSLCDAHPGYVLVADGDGVLGVERLRKFHGQTRLGAGKTTTVQGG
jgi:hypothetical protein